MARNNPVITVTIRADQREWLNRHPEINISGLLQNAVDAEMKSRGD